LLHATEISEISLCLQANYLCLEIISKFPLIGTVVSPGYDEITIMIFLRCPITGCGYQQISDPIDTKLKLRKCNDDGMNPTGPCLKKLDNKKHFIIHTPQHDKVILISISCQLNYSNLLQYVKTNYREFGK